MISSNNGYILLLVVVLIIFIYLYNKYKAKPIEGCYVPKDEYYPFLGHGLLMYRVTIDGTMIEYLYSIFKEKTQFQPFSIAGPLGTSVLSTCNPKHVEYLFKEQFEDFVKGKVFNDLFYEVLGNGVFSTDGDMWRKQRKIASHLFSASSLRNRMTNVFNRNSLHVVDVLDKVCNNKNDNVIDTQTLFQRYTFDSICSIAFGVDVNSLGENKIDLKFVNSYDIAQQVCFARFLRVTWKFERFLQNIFKFGDEGNLKDTLNTINSYVYRIVDDRLKEVIADGGIDNRGDILSLYIEHARKHENEMYSRDFLRDAVFNFIIAGRDTTAAISMWIFYELSLHPKWEELAITEIKKVIGDCGEPTYDQIKDLHILNAIFIEALRLHPSVPIEGKFARRDILLKPGNFFISKDSLVSFNIYSMNRDPKRYENPELFDPSRWLQDGIYTKDKVFMSSKHEELELPVFNVRPRNCLGKPMAIFEAISLICRILPLFKFRLKKGFKYQLNMSPVLFTKNGMKMTVEKRE